jgi:hypothetical protein
MVRLMSNNRYLELLSAELDTKDILFNYDFTVICPGDHGLAPRDRQRRVKKVSEGNKFKFSIDPRELFTLKNKEHGRLQLRARFEK